jgi:uncharacterized membrane protein YbhN (UPF0104 family)
MGRKIEDVDVRAPNAILNLSGWSKPSSTIRGLLLIAITLSIFYFLFRRIPLAEVLGLLSRVPPRAWGCAAFLTLTFPVLSALRWHLILRVMGYSVSVPRCLLIIMGIWPLSSISPSKAGDLLKALSLRDEIRPALVAGSVLAERALDVLTLSLFALAGGLVFREFHIASMAAAVTGAMLCVLLAARFGIRLPVGHKFHQTVQDLFQSLKRIGSRPGPCAAILALTTANWAASIVQTKILFDAVGASVPLGFTAAALPIAIFVGLLPITLGGMATRDSAMVILFSAFATSSQSLAVGLLYSFFGYWLLAVLGIPYVKKALHL